jgi:hypothetical protein
LRRTAASTPDNTGRLGPISAAGPDNRCTGEPQTKSGSTLQLAGFGSVKSLRSDTTNVNGKIDDAVLRRRKGCLTKAKF